MIESFSLDQLAFFVVSVEEGSFSAAGRRLGRVQSAVSHSISTLEDSLGTPLFDRSGHKPVLTPAGRRLFAEARLVLAQARELRACAASLTSGVKPRIMLAVNPAYPMDRLAGLLAQMQVDFPAVSVRLHVGSIGEVAPLVHDGVADIGIGILTPEQAAEPAFEVTPVQEVRLIPVCAPTFPLGLEPPPQSAAVLRRHTQVVLSERGESELEDQGVLGPRTWRVTDLHAKISLLLAGVGWGSVPSGLVADHLADGRLVRLHPAPWPPQGHRLMFSLVVRQDRSLGPPERWLMAALRR